jgi:hypothetical protein
VHFGCANGFDNPLFSQGIDELAYFHFTNVPLHRRRH